MVSKLGRSCWASASSMVSESSRSERVCPSTQKMLTHYIEGFVIEESHDPFPDTFQIPEFVTRKAYEDRLEAKAVEARRRAEKAQQQRLHQQQQYHNSSRPYSSRGGSSSNGNSTQRRTCEMCGVTGASSQFVKSGRFCSLYCTRAYSNQFRHPNQQKGVTARTAGQATSAVDTHGHRYNPDASARLASQAPGGRGLAASAGMRGAKRRGRPPLSAQQRHYTSYAPSQSHQHQSHQHQSHQHQSHQHMPQLHGRGRARGRSSSASAVHMHRPQHSHRSNSDGGNDDDNAGGRENFIDFIVKKTNPPVDCPAALQGTNPTQWSPQDVTTFFQYHDLSSEAKVLYEQEIDGQALSQLRSDHLVSTLGFKVGPSLRIGQLASRLLSGIG